MTAVPIEEKSGMAAVALQHCRTLAGAIFAGSTERAAAQRNAVVAFLVRCASAALLYVSQIALARWMGSAEYGIYVFVWTCVLMAGGLAHLGLNLSIMRLLPLHRERGEWDKVRGLILGGRLFALAAGAAVALAGIAGLALFEPYISNDYRLAAYLALICVPLYAMTDIQDGIGRANGWMDAALIPPYVVRPLLILAFMAAAHAAVLPMIAQTAAGAAIAATWGAGVGQALWINARATRAFGTGARSYAPRLWLASSLPLLAISGCEILLQNTDILVLSRFTTPTDVAIYFAAGKTMSLIMFVHYAVGSAMANKFASLKALSLDVQCSETGAAASRVQQDNIRACVRDAVNWTFWPSLAAAVVILTLGRPLLSLFGPQYVAGFPVMAILVVGFLARSAMGPAEFLLNMQGEQWRCAAVMLTAAALDIVLNLVLVPLHGTTGAAIATAAALTVAAMLNAAVAKTRLGLDVAIWRNWPRG
jgi:O-antigen/teichoic acid export membrane protein